MVFSEHAALQEKLRILSDAAKYDVACTSSGVSRQGKAGEIGNSSAAGICHSFSADGRCISLLKILFTNECIYHCKYCINRASNDVPRATFTPEEVCTLTMEFYRRNYIEGLFLSSGIVRSPDVTMELLCRTLHDLRVKHRFRGYIHCKAIPGASPELIEMAGWYADRMSVNMELPTAEGLRTLAPNKTRRTILTPMRQLQAGMEESRQLLGNKGGSRSAYWHTCRRLGRACPEVQGQGLSALAEDDRQNRQENLAQADGRAQTGGQVRTDTQANGQVQTGGQVRIERKAQADRRTQASDFAQAVRKDVSTAAACKNLTVCQGKSSEDEAVRAAGKGAKRGNAFPAETSSGGLSQWKRYDIDRGFVPAGQSTQMIIGASGESDYEIMAVSEALYRRFDLKRVFYSAFINVNEDPLLPAADRMPPLRREHRLYQADFLLRYYGFEADELLSRERPNFNLFLDPKCDWALGHMECFPVEINHAAYDMLLRVPGIGVKSAVRIVRARRTGSLDFSALKKMGVVLKRAVYFITCQGKMMYDFLKIDEDFIVRRLLLGEERWLRESFEQNRIQYRQLSLFDDVQWESPR